MRHIGWKKCGHGLASRPLETSDPGFLDDLLRVFGYPGGSGALLLAGQFLGALDDRVLCRRGLPMPTSTGICGHTHCLASARV